MKVYKYPKIDKPLVGSANSAKFWEIFNGITFQPNNESRHAVMKDFNPWLNSQDEQTVILLDGKPGLFYYDENVFAFVFSYIRNEKRRAGGWNREMSIYLSVTSRREDNNAFSGGVATICSLKNPEANVCKAVSAFARSALSAVKNHVSDLEAIRKYVYSVDRKSRSFSDWWTVF